ncbi:unnamed protein product [Camellia sinensis]
MVGTLPPNLKLLISNPNSLITVKLDSSNYIIWRSQFLNFLRATDLLGFVTSTHPCPSLKIKDANGAEVFNPKFTIWTTIDTHLLSCITATLSPAIFSCVLHLQRSFEKYIFSFISFTLGWQWDSDLLGYCSEPLLCIKTFFCPCGTFSKIATVATNRHMCEWLTYCSKFLVNFYYLLTTSNWD